MKTNLLLCFISGLIFAFCNTGCQKLYDPGVDITQPEKITTKDKAKLSAALKVWHGTRTTGNPPAPNAQSPSIDPTANPSIQAIAGRFAIIKPEVTSGEIAGYYLSVPTSGQFFKIDFTKPRNIPGRNSFKEKNKRVLRTQGNGNADSSIVIVLPANINAPDTFCVTYCPYDSSGNIGQPVTTCIYVAAFGGGPNNEWLYNDFKLTSGWDDSAGVRINLDTSIYNKWVEGDNNYYCINGTLSGNYNNPGFPILISDSSYFIKNNLRFSLTGAFDYQDTEKNKRVDQFTSTCTQFNFLPVEDYDDIITGGFSYNDQTQKFILVYEFDDAGIPTVEYDVFTLKKITNTNFILTNDIDNYAVRFER